jgi:hypothetical protein
MAPLEKSHPDGRRPTSGQGGGAEPVAVRLRGETAHCGCGGRPVNAGSALSEGTRRRGEELKARLGGRRLGIRANLPPPFLGLLAGSGFLTGDLAGRAFPAAISPEKSPWFVRSLHSSFECPRSSREALSGSGCRPPRWRFSVRHSRDGRREVPPEALGTAVSDGAWFWASRLFPDWRGPVCALPYAGSLRSSAKCPRGMHFQAMEAPAREELADSAGQWSPALFPF